MGDFASKNRDLWSNAAKTYDTKPWQKQLVAQIAEDLCDHRQWLGLEDLQLSDGSPTSAKGPVRLLDYACGPGTVSQALLPYITSSTGIDVAPGMVEEYNRRTADAGLSHLHAVNGDLCSAQGVSEDLMDEKLFGFDVAAISMGFHHFEHLQLSVDRLVERLRPGGVLFIVDLLEDHGERSIGDHAHDHGNDFMKEAARTVPHKHGFSRDNMEKLFNAAGCKDFDFEVLDRPAVMGEGESAFEKKMFIAKAAKA